MKKTKFRGVYVRGDSIVVDIQIRRRRHRETLRIPPTPANLRHAKRYRDSLLFDFEVGRHRPEQKSVVLADAVEQFLRDNGHRLKRSTLSGYWKIFDSRADLLSVSTLEIDTGWILRWRQREIDAGISTKRINNVHSLVRSALDHAVELGQISENVFARVRFLPAKSPRVEPLSPAEIETLFAACVDARERRFLAVATFSGMRTGELIALVWDDVDLANRTIRVERNFVEGHVTTPKTASGIRQIPIFPILLPFLELGGEPNEPVLANPEGDRWASSSQIRKRFWLPLLERVGIPYRKPYALRHTFASLALSAGEDPSQVAAWMGHADWAMIRKTYAKWIPSASPVAPGSRLGSVLASRLDVSGSPSGTGWQTEAFLSDPDEEF